jgi:membrane-associated phospholipid phosphatase
MCRPHDLYDYRQLRLNNLTAPQFRHLFLLIYWPLYGLGFFYLERVHPVDFYFPMYCPLDDYIPFLEIFVFPYLFWFVFLVGIHLYTLLFDVKCFKKLMYYIIFTYSATLVIFTLFPNCQELRPTVFPRDNFLTRFMAGFYQFDTNTNVCPSLHVIGSMAVVFASCHTPRLRKLPWQIFFWTAGLAISISTVFLKQHSILDVIYAIPVCVAGYVLCYWLPTRLEKKKEHS